MSEAGRQDAANRTETGSVSGTMGAPDGPVPNRPKSWKFIAVWIAFAITFLLTVVLGIQVVLSTKGLD